MRHERQVLLEDWDQDALSRARMAIVGCGALGSSLAISLARLGVGSMVLIDPDTLQEHNLENQAYDIHDLGHAKTQALARRVKAIDATIDVQPMRCRVQDVHPDLDVDYWLGGLDNVAARYYLNHIAHTSGTPLVDAGIHAFRGTVRTIVPRESACYACWPTLPRAAAKVSCSQDPIPSTYITANVTANLQAMQLLKLIRGQAWRGHVTVDLERGLLHQGDLEVNRDCMYCGEP